MAKTYLEPGEVVRLENAAKYLRDRLLIRTLFWVGCRISEALGLHPRDIDFNRGVVNIQHLKSRTRLLCPHCDSRLSRKAKFCSGCGHEVEEPTRRNQETRRRRELPVDADSLAMMKEFIQRDKVKQNDLIFRISRAHAWRIISDTAKSAGLPDLFNAETGQVHRVSPHRLRDAFAVMAVKQDSTLDGVRQLQQHLGHANINTTMRYRKLSGEEQQDWYNKVAAGVQNGQ